MTIDVLAALPEHLRRQSISQDEIVLPEAAALEALDALEAMDAQISGWEGWVRDATGRVGHRDAPQGTASLEHLSPAQAAAFCRATIRNDADEWRRAHEGSGDRLYFCIGASTTGKPRSS